VKFTVKVGLVAPVFLGSPRAALSVAQHAEQAGIDGVFSYDHLFPIGSPNRPALSAIPMLAAMAVGTERIRLGTLVCRVTLLPVPVLVESLVTLDEIAGHRAIAGLGAGDSLTAPENDAYGLPFPALDERLRLLAEAARALRKRGVTTWIGGRSRHVRAIAAADADGWNAWDGPLDQLAAFAAANSGGAAATWGGPPPADGDFAGQLSRLAQAGVEWAVYGPPPSIEWDPFVAKLAGAAKAVR
jgi:alkanesulfonate monooxygenase SsuD/methylene tetrahydromethanopterin reductase-like flavin-dependent oxidoreductase (luciferase family)